MTRTSAVRRLASLLVLPLIGALFLTGCSSDDSTPDPSGSSDSPVSVDTAYGTLDLDTRPERIVALSTQYADMLSALGIEPVAFSAGSGADPEDFPWLKDLDLGTFDPGLLGIDGVLAAEQAATYEPDLILGNVWSVDEGTYSDISRATPTYVGATDGNPDWTDTLRDVAALTGTTNRAEKVIDDLDARFSESRDVLPGLQGKTYNYVGYFGSNEFAYGNGSWLDGFGLEPSDSQDNSQSGATVAMENLPLLDADILTIFVQSGSPDDIRKDPRFADLPSVRNGTVTFLDFTQALAVTAPGPHSLTWAIDLVQPTFETSGLNTGGH